MIRFLLDTDISSYFLKSRLPRLTARIRTAMEAEEAAISAVTRAELRFGQHLMGEQGRHAKLIDAFLTEIPTLDWTGGAAERYGRIAAEQRLKGEPIGALDTQIAAHALAEGLTLVTNNERHFGRISGLRIENWAL